MTRFWVVSMKAVVQNTCGSPDVLVRVHAAGAVGAVGTDVTRFQAGDEVFGEYGGSFAEYAVAHQDKLVPKSETSPSSIFLKAMI